MGDKKKTLCTWKKEKLKERFEEYRKLVMNARYVCRNCGRSSKEDRFLCKPADLDQGA
jgi:hypothetical protein